MPVNPAIAPVLAHYPLPNEPQGPYGARTYAASSKVVTNSDQFSVRIDHKLSEKATLFARFSLNQVSGPTTNPDQTAIDPDFGVKFFDHQRQRGGALLTRDFSKSEFHNGVRIHTQHAFFPDDEPHAARDCIRRRAFSRVQFGGWIDLRIVRERLLQIKHDMTYTVMRRIHSNGWAWKSD